MLLFVSACIVAIVAAGCTGFGGNGKRGTGGNLVHILAYNVENLFDDVSNGTEYPEFDPKSGKWNTTLYHERLDNVAKVVRDSVRGGPDIVAFEEIENMNVLKALLRSHLAALGYTSYVLVPVAGSAINIGVLTKYPVTSVWTHAVVSTSDHPLRAVVEISLDCNGIPLVLLACHWKSKSGGAAQTEQARIEAAGIVARREREILSQNPDAEIVVLGDLNENVDEFERIGGSYQTGLIAFDGVDTTGHGVIPPAALPSYFRDSIIVSPNAALVPSYAAQLDYVPANERGGASGTAGDSQTVPPLILYSPWGTLGAGGTKMPVSEGSYWYHDWETIDQFLLSPGMIDGKGLTFADFQVIRLPYLVDKYGHPAAWYSDRRSGYSDHLPVLLVLRRAAGQVGGP